MTQKKGNFSDNPTKKLRRELSLSLIINPGRWGSGWKNQRLFFGISIVLLVFCLIILVTSRRHSHSSRVTFPKMAAKLASSSTASVELPFITRLPPFFPTSTPACQSVTEPFFQCFEAHAVMKHDKDTESARTSLHHCQSELRVYIKCMEAEEAKAAALKLEAAKPKRAKVLGIF